MKKRFFSFANIVSLIILVGAVMFIYHIYRVNNFNDFQRSERNIGISTFVRDSNVKYSDNDSYKITSDQNNDAMFYKQIEVDEYTPYRVKCMVKTENVVPENENNAIGAQISINGTTERSVAISGTNDWQEIEFIFNSKNRTTIELGFRLGGNAGICTGKAWFSDFSIEKGTPENSNNWSFVNFIFKSTQVNINGNQINISATNSDIEDITETAERFVKTCGELSNGKMTATCDTYIVDTPITSLSYDKEFGYYVAPEDVESQIKLTLNKKNYDHIFITTKLGDEDNKDSIEVKDWIGLGAMDYYGMGFSNIRLPNENKSYIYKYSPFINTFPEEVFLHEFLHTLERTATECGYEVPALHDFEKYGYKNEQLIGQKKWYTDYMNKSINSGGKLIGLPSQIYSIKPGKQSNFDNSEELKDVFKQPKNIFEETREMFGTIFRNLNARTNLKENTQ